MEILILRRYSEAIDVLYTANTFSLKGARGIFSMSAIVPTPHWHVIRHLQISTTFHTPRSMHGRGCEPPPENFRMWTDACKSLHDLRGLHSLCLDIIFRETTFSEVPVAEDTESLLSIFEPIKNINVPVFEIEMNFPLSETFQPILGKRNCSIVVKERPYNWELFPERR